MPYVGSATGGASPSAPCRTIFLSAFNRIWHSYAGHNPRHREEIVFHAAWAAVKWYYHKTDRIWVARNRFD